MQEADFLLYTAPDGEVKIEIYLQDETIWLSQQKIAELFRVSKFGISEHLSNIFKVENYKKMQVFGISKQFRLMYFR